MRGGNPCPVLRRWSVGLTGMKTMHEMRYFFSQWPPAEGVLQTNDILVCVAYGENRSDEQLRDYIMEYIDKSGERARYESLLKSHYLSVDVGRDKDHGGLGASVPLETVILTRPPYPPTFRVKSLRG